MLTPSFIRFSSILQNTLLITGNRVTPPQLLQPNRLPFLNISTISPFFHNASHFSAFHILIFSLVSVLAVISILALRRFGPTSSTPVAFPFFVLFSAFVTSCTCHALGRFLQSRLPLLNCHYPQGVPVFLYLLFTKMFFPSLQNTSVKYKTKKNQQTQ